MRLLVRLPPALPAEGVDPEAPFVPEGLLIIRLVLVAATEVLVETTRVR